MMSYRPGCQEHWCRIPALRQAVAVLNIIGSGWKRTLSIMWHGEAVSSDTKAAEELLAEFKRVVEEEGLVSH